MEDDMGGDGESGGGDRGDQQEEATGEEGPARPKRKFKILNGGAVFDQPPPMWRIDGTIPDGIVQLVGPSRSLKTFLALDWACRIAAGIPWEGKAVESGPVLYVAAEGGAGIGSRYQAWLTAHNNGEPIPNMNFVLAPVVPTNTADLLDVVGGLGDLGLKKMALIVIDTVARCFEGDENSTADMSAFVASLDGLRRRTKATILVVHHTGWDKSHQRGSSALFNGCDAVAMITRDDLGTATLTCTKQKDAPEFDSRRFVFDPVEGTESGVLVAMSQSTNTTHPYKEEHKLILDALEVAGLGGLTFGALKEATGVHRKPTLSAALKALEGLGLVSSRGEVSHRGRLYFRTSKAT